MRVTLVRHAEPVASADVPAELWPLTDAGRRAALALRDRLLLVGGRWVASREVKALETLHCLAAGAVVAQDARFDEVRRVEPFDDGFLARRLAWVEGRPDARHDGWETFADAARRFDAGIREHAAGTDHLVVGSHGMVVTAWLVFVGRVEAGADAGRFWQALGFPDVVEVSLT